MDLVLSVLQGWGPVGSLSPLSFGGLFPNPVKLRFSALVASFLCSQGGSLKFTFIPLEVEICPYNFPFPYVSPPPQPLGLITFSMWLAVLL